MRVTVTGATGGIGALLVRRLLERGDEVTVLARDAGQAKAKLGAVNAYTWDALKDPAPVEALRGRDAVVHLAGETIAQRWTADAKTRINASRADGTRHLVAGLEAAGDERPGTLIAGSALGFYGDRTGAGPIDESEPAGESGFLPQVVVAWESASRGAEALGVRVVLVRTANVLARDFGALPQLAKLTRFGLSGPLGGGRQPFPWIHVDDEVGLLLHVLDTPSVSGPINAVAPEPITQARFAKALGRVMHRPAIAPAPAFAVRLIVGEMAELVLTGAEAVPTAARDSGYEFRYPALRAALQDTAG